ncbi:MAG TPA: Fe-S cluster assembly protein SufB [Candidatus Paceibacterota bacterium]|nr:Fe-S cluster assembly protein SufB [Candidatus Paceibacterota bacterium]
MEEDQQLYTQLKKVVLAVSAQKQEPLWVREIRLNALKQFIKLALPAFLVPLVKINLHDLKYYLKPDINPDDWKKKKNQEFFQLMANMGIPEDDMLRLGGIGLQEESEMVYDSLEKKWQKEGVIFTSIDKAIQKYPKLVQKYFGSVIATDNNKFSALNTALFSGGSFLYVPKGVKVDKTIQVLYRINREEFGQFERTLIIAEPDSQVSYLEGCTAPMFAGGSLHAGVVEVIVNEGAKVRYGAVQNWSKEVYNLATKGAKVLKNGQIEWMDANFGSKLTVKYPLSDLRGDNSRAIYQSINSLTKGQTQYSGAKVIHSGKNTLTDISSKSLIFDGGYSYWQPFLQIKNTADSASNFSRCDNILFGNKATYVTEPITELDNVTAKTEVEGSLFKIEEETLNYLATRGIGTEEAYLILILSFYEPLSHWLPADYLLEIKQMLALTLSTSI